MQGKITAAAVAGAGILMTLAVPTGAAQAASTDRTVVHGTSVQARVGSCYASGCNHKNPYKTICVRDGKWKQKVFNYDGQVAYLYYSRKCRAVWTEMWNAPKGTKIGVLRVSSGSPASYARATSNPHTWTGMISDKGYKAVAQICANSVSICYNSGAY